MVSMHNAFQRICWFQTQNVLYLQYSIALAGVNTQQVQVECEIFYNIKRFRMHTNLLHLSQDETL